MLNKWAVIFLLGVGLFAYWGLKGLVSGDIKLNHDRNSTNLLNLSVSSKAE